MRNQSNGGKDKRIKQWISSGAVHGKKLFSNPSVKKFGQAVRRKLPKKLRHLDLNLKKVELKNVSDAEPWLRRALLVLAVFFAAEIAVRIAGLFVLPTYPQVTKRTTPMARRERRKEQYDSITQRNIFNVEGTIPDPLDQGKLDCFSTAKPSQQKINLLGTIVMGNDALSVALVQEESNPIKIAVKKDEAFFDSKYQAVKIERRRFCFQVKTTQDFEFVEIPDDSVGLGVAGAGGGSSGITAVSETEFAVQKSFLDREMQNLNEILQTARAVPYLEPGTGKFKGFLVQSIDDTSPFAQLGIRRGDVLMGVNDIVLDNAGKGLEAFQRLRNSSQVELRVIRGGSETTINYKVK